jgi:serine/threonine protein kinase
MLDAKRETGPTPDAPASDTSCPAPARFWTAVLGGDSWSPAERRHIADCPQCRQSERQVHAATGTANKVDPSTETTLAAESHGDPLIMSTACFSGPISADATVPPDSVMSATTVSFGTQGSLLTLGDYDLIREIGRGGMGMVYLALDRRLNRRVAIKARVSFGRDENHRLDRFLSEARILAQLAHPSILPILDVGQHADLSYIVTPFIEGQSLSSMLSSSGPLPAHEAARIIAEIADAVHHVHECGIIHRDIKPSNILVDTNNSPVLMDFGLAKAAEDEASLTCEGQFLGTPAYMSPEQAERGAHALDQRTDIYSLGATLYALLTGGPPYKGSSALDTLRRLQSEEPPRPRLLNPAIDGDLEAVCLKALQRDPARRYRAACDLADDLRRYLRGAPVLSRPPAASERAFLWVRRHPTSSALLTLLTVGSLILAVFFWRQDSVIELGLQPTKIIPLTTTANAKPAQTSIGSKATRPTPPRAIAPADLASALNDLGRLYRDLDRPTEAEAAYRRSAAILLQLTRAHPEIAAYQRGLADAYQNLAELLRASRRLGETDTIDQAARAVRASLKSDQQDPPVLPTGLDPFPR